VVAAADTETEPAEKPKAKQRSAFCLTLSSNPIYHVRVLDPRFDLDSHLSTSHHLMTAADNRSNTTRPFTLSSSHPLSLALSRSHLSHINPGHISTYNVPRDQPGKLPTTRCLIVVLIWLEANC
jgi:hypothetical protein